MRADKTTSLRAWGVTVLRVTTGYLFLTSGVHTLFIGGLGELGSPLPAPVVVVAALVELVCGTALVVGLLARWASTPLVLLMLADLAVFHTPRAVFVDDAGYEYALLRLAASGALALAGPGKLALDNVLASRRKAQR